MPQGPTAPRLLGRYALHGEIASGGMASVHFGRLLGPVGFARTVAIKRLHPQYARDHEFVAMFLDEARLAARVRHPNVATVSDVIAIDDELFLVMDYVHGVSLAELARAAQTTGARIPPRIAAGIVHGALAGLHAAHTATSESGEPLGIVHRDVSPENLIVGVDGITRVLDFGIAFAAQRAHHTREGQVKGKLGYTAPELLEGDPATPRVDVYSAGVVLWEATVGRRLFVADNEVKMLGDILRGDVPPPTTIVPALPLDLDAVALRAMSRRAADRYPTADELAIDVERRLQPAPPREIGAWVAAIAREPLARLSKQLADVEGARPVREPKSYPPPAASLSASAAREPGADATVVDPLRFDDATIVDPTVPTATRANLLARPPAAEAGAPASTPTADARETRTRVVTGERIALSLALAALLLVGARSLAPPQRELPSVAPMASAPVAASAPRDPAPPEPPREAPPSPAASAPAPPPIADRPTLTTITRPVAAPPPSAAAAPAPRNTAATDRLKRAGCNPPYTVDETGHHHFKPSCM